MTDCAINWPSITSRISSNQQGQQPSLALEAPCSNWPHLDDDDGRRREYHSAQCRPQSGRHAVKRDLSAP
eukprot:m.175015 g.175015  ORF g.175015 m.175015 type:complete len:70 (+) comp16764_c0_seq3:25-234(+)